MKIVSAFLAAALLASMTFTAFAADSTIGENGSQDIEVQAKYVDSTTTADVYSVDVEWGAMQFTYSVTGTRQWNASDHSYTVADPAAAWTQTGNTIKVTNHSNVGVAVGFSFTKLATVTESITASFAYDKSAAGDSVSLAAGVEGKAAEADNVTATLTLAGDLGSDKLVFTKVGTVTVTLT